MSNTGQNIRSAVVSADGVVSAVPCELYGVICDASGGAILYDNASAASGTVVVQIKGPDSIYFGGDSIHCKNGIYVDLTSANVTVFFN